MAGVHGLYEPAVRAIRSGESHHAIKRASSREKKNVLMHVQPQTKALKLRMKGYLITERLTKSKGILWHGGNETEFSPIGSR